MQDTRRFVIFAYLVIGLVLAMTLSRILGGVAYLLNAPDAAIFGNNFTVTTLIADVLAIGIGWYAFKNERANSFASEVVQELKKVTWPSKKETQTAVVVVIVTTLITALLLGVMDAVWSNLTGVFYNK